MTQLLPPLPWRLINGLLSSALILLGAAASAQAHGAHYTGNGPATLSPALVANGSAITVHRTENCGCCTAWEQHMSAAGFAVTDVVNNRMEALKSAHGITPELESCHTGLVDGYVIEGHVPATAVQRLLNERPAIRGLTAPGIPMGSPGMEGDGITPEPYAVLAIHNDGNTSVFERYTP